MLKYLFLFTKRLTQNLFQSTLKTLNHWLIQLAVAIILQTVLIYKSHK